MSKMIDHFPFENFRKGQKKLINMIEKCFEEYNTVIAQIPTGVGKSPISISAIDFYGNGHILTNQKSLQEQYLRDFNISKVDGRSNYYCQNCDNITCDMGKCVTDSNFKCLYKPSTQYEDNGSNFACVKANGDILYWNPYTNIRCPYWDQKCYALNDSDVIHNYPYLLNEANHARFFGTRNILVCDEGHNIESHLLDFNQVELTKRDIDNIQQLFNVYGNNIEKWVLYLTNYEKNRLPDLIKNIEMKIKEIENKISHMNNSSYKDDLYAKKIFLIRTLDKKRKTQTKLKFFIYSASKNPKNWIIDTENDIKFKDELYKLTFKPIVISDYAHFQLFQYGEKRLIISATILDPEVVAKNLGIKDYVFINVDPYFPPENKPIYHLNIGNFSGDALKESNPNNKIEEMVDAIDLILDVINEKGIIHTTTFTIADAIKERSRHSDRILTHNSKNRVDVINEHLTSNQPTVLCSPSMTEGLDLYDNLSRFQILIKVPYPDLSDIVIKAKKDKDEEEGVPFNQSWYNWKTKIDLVQAYGRSIRNDDDYAFTFTFDSRFSKFCKMNAEIKTKTEYGGFKKEKTLFASSFNDFVKPFDEFLDMEDGLLRKLFEKAVLKHGRNTNWIVKYL